MQLINNVWSWYVGTWESIFDKIFSWVETVLQVFFG